MGFAAWMFLISESSVCGTTEPAKEVDPQGLNRLRKNTLSRASH